MQMRQINKQILLLALVASMCDAAPQLRAQWSHSGRNNISGAQAHSISVCENVAVNTQVKAALSLVCARQGSDQASASAQGLIVIGFLGGFAKDGDTNHPEVWFGDYLRELYPSADEVSVVSNHQHQKALTDVQRLLDADQNGDVTAAEKKQAKIILYGHSWGASETVTFAQELGRLDIPVLLTVQIDIVPKPGQQPLVIPANVGAAVNFFQSEEHGFLHGRREVIAEDPGRTEIIGNLRMSYEGRHVDCRNYPWLPRTFNKPHHEIENDARVWKQIASIIDSRLSLRNTLDQAATHGGRLTNEPGVSVLNPGYASTASASDGNTPNP